jgi:hypothetical protein
MGDKHGPCTGKVAIPVALLLLAMIFYMIHLKFNSHGLVRGSLLQLRMATSGVSLICWIGSGIMIYANRERFRNSVRWMLISLWIGVGCLIQGWIILV